MSLVQELEIEIVFYQIFTEVNFIFHALSNLYEVL